MKKNIKRDIFNIIYYMIEDYEKYTGEKPYIMLINPETYNELIKYLKDTNSWRYLQKLKTDKNKINYIFGIPLEISYYIIQNAICMNERDYNEYCKLIFTYYN